jgi:hypothetical protein
MSHAILDKCHCALPRERVQSVNKRPEKLSTQVGINVKAMKRELGLPDSSEHHENKELGNHSLPIRQLA